jgi:hypothetical protein
MSIFPNQWILFRYSPFYVESNRIETLASRRYSMSGGFLTNLNSSGFMVLEEKIIKGFSLT